MSERHLPVFILQQVAESALQDAGNTAAEAGRVIAQTSAPAAGFNTD